MCMFESPEPVKVNLFGKRVFAVVTKYLEMRPSWTTRVDPRFNPNVLIIDTRRKGRGNVKTEAELKVIQSQFKECLESIETGIDKEQNLS